MTCEDIEFELESAESAPVIRELPNESKCQRIPKIDILNKTTKGGVIEKKIPSRSQTSGKN